MSAKELADWLRTIRELPLWSRSMEQNLRTPVWTTGGRTHAMAPLHRLSFGSTSIQDAVLYVDAHRLFHMTGRSTALRYFSPQWGSFEHPRVVPQRPEWTASYREVTNDLALLSSQWGEAVRGNLTELYVAAAPAGAVPISLISWIIDLGRRSRYRVQGQRGAMQTSLEEA